MDGPSEFSTINLCNELIGGIIESDSPGNTILGAMIHGIVLLPAMTVYSVVSDIVMIVKKPFELCAE